jgi:PucR family transcriptional regulator, purine catabolism regulatory protein
MNLHIFDILQLEIMKDAKVLAGAKLINERFVQWVSAIEMPVESFVRKNEFVLTTAIGCGHDL